MMSATTALETRAAGIRQAAEAATGKGAPVASGMDSRELRHEIANALTVALAYAQWLLSKRSMPRDEREDRALRAIRDSVARANRLLERPLPTRPPGPCDL